METGTPIGKAPNEVSKNKKTRYVNVMFSIIFLVIMFAQTFYWIFANRLQPILVGMPFGMFFITALIIIEFVCLILLYKFQEK